MKRSATGMLSKAVKRNNKMLLPKMKNIGKKIGGAQEPDCFKLEMTISHLMSKNVNFHEQVICRRR